MYHIAKKRGSIQEPIWIELDISILFDENTLFSDNVANRNNANIFKKDSLLENIDFNTLVYEKDFNRKKEARKAEIMVLNSINTDKILGVTYGN